MSFGKSLNYCQKFRRYNLQNECEFLLVSLHIAAKIFALFFKYRIHGVNSVFGLNVHEATKFFALVFLVIDYIKQLKFCIHYIEQLNFSN